MEQRCAGRPRDEQSRRAILKAAIRLLKQHGFSAISSQQIAREAGVSTATLYRWWKTKQNILLDAYLETTRELLPDRARGSALQRLRRYTIRIAEFLNSEDGVVFFRLIGAAQDDPALRREFHEKIFLPRRAEGCKVVQEAIDTGELPPTVNPELMINCLIGPQILPPLMGRPLSPKTAGEIFDLVIQASGFSRGGK